MQDLINPIFQSPENLESAFVDGLDNMLAQDELGVFILVLANALFDDKLWKLLKPKLIKKFEHLKSQPITGADDDVAVFNKLIKLDLNELEVTKWREIGGFEVQYNPLRALRPQRLSGAKTQGMSAEFDENGFHFNKPFLQKEIFWSGQFFSKNVSLFYNKFPFANFHGLVVVESEKQHPQLLTYELHQFAWMMANTVSLNIPGFSLAYNAYGAYASVNHFHLQCFIRDKALPIENDEKYPLVNYAFQSVGDAWEFIEALHRDEQPYNLVYQNNKILCVVRQRQDDYTHADWTAGYAWYEACGGVSTFDLDSFNNLKELDLKEELLKLKIT
jgi:ATP adenylyltransferase/5',5'''-P-1,P-4-tetraphosphate phosphorylase II